MVGARINIMWEEQLVDSPNEYIIKETGDIYYLEEVCQQLNQK